MTTSLREPTPTKGRKVENKIYCAPAAAEWAAEVPALRQPENFELAPPPFLHAELQSLGHLQLRQGCLQLASAEKAHGCC